RGRVLAAAAGGPAAGRRRPLGGGPGPEAVRPVPGLRPRPGPLATHGRAGLTEGRCPGPPRPSRRETSSAARAARAARRGLPLLSPARFGIWPPPPAR